MLNLIRINQAEGNVIRMKVNSLILKKIIAFATVYLFYALSFFIFLGYFGSQIDPVKSSTKDSQLNMKCVMDQYGNENQLYNFINNVFDFLNALIPSKMSMLIFLFCSYVLYFLFVLYVDQKPVDRNSWRIYYAKAMGSIASGLSSLIYFITASLMIILSYSIYKFSCLIALNVSLFVMTIVYMVISFFIFLLDEYCTQVLNRVDYRNRIVGLKVNKRWYEFWKPDHY